jgi:hypothetical protein
VTPRRLGAVGGVVVAVGLVIWATSARAQEDDDGKPPPVDAPAPDAAAGPGDGKDAGGAKDDGAKDDGAKQDDGAKDDGAKDDGALDDGKPDPARDGKKKRPPIQVTGRVYVRETLDKDRGEPWEGELALESARIGVAYRWKDRLRARISLEANTEATDLIRDIVRDAYIELLAGHGVAVRAGRFKLPISIIEGTSSWRLPTIDRGILSDVLGAGVLDTAGIDLTGRRDGVGVDWSPAAPLAPRLEVVAWQSLDEEGVAGAGLVSRGAGLSFAGRASLSPLPWLEAGVVGSWRGIEDDLGALLRYWAVGVDGKVDLDPTETRPWGVRVWADALVGASLDQESQFLAAQVIAAWRWGGADRGRWYVEPYVSLAYYDPSRDRPDDSVREVIGGVAGGRWRRWRVQAQLAGVHSHAELELGVGDETKVLVQLGAAF